MIHFSTFLMKRALKMNDKLHPFEAAGLGKAPFIYVGMEHKIGPITMADGITQIGSPGQPMGSCDYCGKGIAYCYSIKSADGKRFVVGSDCVAKLYKESNVDASALALDKVYQAIKAEKNLLLAKARHKREDAALAAGMVWAEGNKVILQSMECPSKYHAKQTQWDVYEWYMRNAGCKGKLGCIQVLQRLIEGGKQ